MQRDLSFGRFTIRVTLVHMATYMVAGGDKPRLYYREEFAKTDIESV